MKLIEALAHVSANPVTITNGWYKGRQFRWCNGHIQTRPPKSQYWNRPINISTQMLEWAEVDDNEIL